ncbi:ABC transporter substrate-binding protein [Pseudomonas sp. NPDC078700]|uniref:cytochrome c/ABC transporter substrate-binding protein n=1 Tax=Pseudomonas sp. NPDC078700 TaxID=3364424 RepID=UPI0037CB0CFA
MARFAHVLGTLLWVCGHAVALELTPEEAAGKQLFTQGISATGADITALVGASSAAVPATVVPCANCHGADGRGRPEGGVRPPDITWRRLSVPYGQLASNGRSHPAYTDAGIARAVSEGVDPGGNTLDPAMPRFVMSMHDMSNLNAYLKRLEDDRDPGVQHDLLSIGTLLPLHGPLAELGTTVAQVLKGTVEAINQSGGIHGRQLRLIVVDAGVDRHSGVDALNTLLDQNQVFALVSPMMPALDGQYDALLQSRGVPLVGALELSGEGPRNRLIFAPLPGVVEQLQALGKFARQSLAVGQSDGVIVYAQDPAQQRLAQLLQLRLQHDGWQQISLQVYQQDNLDDLVMSAGRGGAVFFLGQSQTFNQLTEGLNQREQYPYLFAVSAQVAGGALDIARGFNQRVFLAYPFVPSDWTEEGVQALTAIRTQSGLGSAHAVLQVSAYCAALLLSEGLKRAGREVSREKLITELENLHNFRTGLTPMLSFGPGQRVGASGAHIVMVDSSTQRFQATGQYISVDSDL